MHMNLAERDSKHLWHPYTQHKTASPPIGITRGEGALLWDEDGKQYIDAIASWWVNPYGHSNRYIADAIYKQLTTLEHVLFGGFTHEPAVLLCERLAKILPLNQQKFFFSDNGSTSVEVAIKASLQYFYNKGETRKTIVAFEDAFHGDTFAAMAASGISLYTQAFAGMFIDVLRIPVPVKGREKESAERLQHILSTTPCAAFIFEPLVLGAAGMLMYEPDALDTLLQICRDHQVLTIADEVMTGFGRTGSTFASDFLSIPPDMMCLSKALTGGTIPMALTTFSPEVFDGFYSDDINKALFHGHTFTANPTGCAAALASLDLLQSEETTANLTRIRERNNNFAAHIRNHEKVLTVRTRGIILALEVSDSDKGGYYGNLRNRLYDFFISRGFVMRPMHNIIYILPPYVITDDQLDAVYQIIEEALELV